MSQLKFELQKNEFVAPKHEPENIHFVIKIDLHRVYLRRERDDEIFSYQKRLLNMGWMKVKPEVAKVLYEKMQEPESRNTTKAKS